MRLEAMHHPGNPASGRVLAKVGFPRTGTADRHAEGGTAVPAHLMCSQTAPSGCWSLCPDRPAAVGDSHNGRADVLKPAHVQVSCW
ncbi:GNAT family N-acetyltransferase [Streptomyces sp. NBC_00400]